MAVGIEYGVNVTGEEKVIAALQEIQRKLKDVHDARALYLKDLKDEQAFIDKAQKRPGTEDPKQVRSKIAGANTLTGLVNDTWKAQSKLQLETSKLAPSYTDAYVAASVLQKTMRINKAEAERTAFAMQTLLTASKAASDITPYKSSGVERFFKASEFGSMMENEGTWAYKAFMQGFWDAAKSYSGHSYAQLKAPARDMGEVPSRESGGVAGLLGSEAKPTKASRLSSGMSAFFTRMGGRWDLFKIDHASKKFNRLRKGEDAAKKGGMSFGRTMKWNLGLLLMMTNAFKKLIGNTQVVSAVFAAMGSAFGFIFDMIFLPLLPILMEVVKWLYGVGKGINTIMKYVGPLAPVLSLVLIGLLAIGSAAVLGGIGNAILGILGIGVAAEGATAAVGTGALAGGGLLASLAVLGAWAAAGIVVALGLDSVGLLEALGDALSFAWNYLMSWAYEVEQWLASSPSGQVIGYTLGLGWLEPDPEREFLPNYNPYLEKIGEYQHQDFGPDGLSYGNYKLLGGEHATARAKGEMEEGEGMFGMEKNVLLRMLQGEDVSGGTDSSTHQTVNNNSSVSNMNMDGWTGEQILAFATRGIDKEANRS